MAKSGSVRCASFATETLCSFTLRPHQHCSSRLPWHHLKWSLFPLHAPNLQTPAMTTSNINKEPHKMITQGRVLKMK